jgi:hypothetical protein
MRKLRDKYFKSFLLVFFSTLIVIVCLGEIAASLGSWVELPRLTANHLIKVDSALVRTTVQFFIYFHQE